MKFLILALFFSGAVYAQDFTKGKGEFLAEENDKLTFIKEQLIHEGIKDIISQDLQSMNLNHELFWTNYNEKLMNSLESYDSSLKSQYKIDENPTEAQLSKYRSLLRDKRLKTRLNFIGMKSVVSSYVIKKISRSVQNPLYRIIRLEAKLNQDKLADLYYRVTKGEESSDFASLKIRSTFDLQAFGYSDIKVENRLDFTQVIEKSWIDWFEQNKPANVKEISILENGKNITDMNSILVDLLITIKLEEFKEESQFYHFAIGGSAYLKDVQANRTIKTFEFNSVQKKFNLSAGMNIGNILANSIYRAISGYFPVMKQSIKEFNHVSNTISLAVSGHGKLDKVYEFIEMAHRQGGRYSLSLSLNQLNKEKLTLFAFLNGGIEELRALLISMKGVKNIPQYEIIDQEGQIEVKFI